MDFLDNTRGFRNNNPGNIRHGNNWNGETEGDDKQFETFQSVEYGIRSIHILLNTFASHYNVITIEDIIHRYAPPHENSTNAYIKTVYQYMLDHATNEQGAYLLNNQYQSNIHNHQLKPLFIGGLILVENGLQPFNVEFIKECEYICDN